MWLWKREPGRGGYAYLHDASANKNVHVSKASTAVCVFASPKSNEVSPLRELGAVFLEAPSYLENRTYEKSSRTHLVRRRNECFSNAMLLRFASGVPYGFRDRQRFDLVPKITTTKMCKALSSHQIESVFARIREQHTRGRPSPTGLAWCRRE